MKQECDIRARQWQRKCEREKGKIYEGLKAGNKMNPERRSR